MAGRMILRMAVWTLTALTALAGAVSPAVASNAFDYTVIFKQDGVDTPVLVRAWIPDNVPLRGVLYEPPALGGDTRYSVNPLQDQIFANALGLGIIGMHDRDGFPGHYEGATAAEIRSNVQMILDGAASGLSCPQISNAPLAFYGYSKGGWMDAEIASYLPERTICFVADKSDTWISSISDQAALVPGLFIGGSKDTAAGSGAGYSAFSVWRSPKNGEVALVEDWNVAHASTSFSLVESFIAESMARRYPAGQLPSATPGNPLALNQINPSSGWLVESSYNGGFTWIRCPEAAPVASYSKTASTACWVPTQAMAMVLRAENAANPTTGVMPVDIWSPSWPQPPLYAYVTGQTIDVKVTNSTLNSADITRVEIFHEDQLIGDFPSLAGVAHYTFADAGVHTFWTEVTYLYGGQPTYATDYFTAVALVPEPGTLALLACGALLVLCRRQSADE